MNESHFILFMYRIITPTMTSTATTQNKITMHQAKIRWQFNRNIITCAYLYIHIARTHTCIHVWYIAHTSFDDRCVQYHCCAYHHHHRRHRHPYIHCTYTYWIEKRDADINPKNKQYTQSVDGRISEWNATKQTDPDNATDRPAERANERAHKYE